ncbi:MAG: hypothetical protein V3G42_04965 [Oscillospiraceae bacterium]
MFFRELHEFSRHSLKGHYLGAFRTAVLCPIVETVTGIVPLILGAILIARKSMTPKALLMGNHTMWVIFGILWGILSFSALLPIRCGVWSWFTALLGMEKQKRKYFATTGEFFHAMYFFGMIALLRWLILTPCAVAGILAYFALQRSIAVTESGILLFIAIQAMMLLFWTMVFWVRFTIGLLAVPFLYLENPEISVFRAVRKSEKMLAGHHKKLFALLLGYLPLALPIVTIPFILPKIMTEVILFLQIRMKEYAQEELICLT